MMGWFGKSAPPKLELAVPEIRKLLRILFIDDQPMSMADALRTQGYNTFQKYDLDQISDLEKQEYHLIFCDIRGVGQKMSKDEGAGLIKLIKQQVQYPIVIAYSAEAYQPGSEHELTMRKVADDIIRKDAAVDEYIATVNRWGAKFFSTERCVAALTALLKVDAGEAARIVAAVGKDGHASSDWKKYVLAGEAVKTVLDVAVLIAHLAGTAS